MRTCRAFTGNHPPVIPGAWNTAACALARRFPSTNKPKAKPIPVCHTAHSEYMWLVWPCALRNVSVGPVRFIAWTTCQKAIPKTGPNAHPATPRKPPSGVQQSTLASRRWQLPPELNRNETAHNVKNAPTNPPTNNACPETFPRLLLLRKGELSSRPIATHTDKQ